MFKRTANDLGLDLVLNSVSSHALSPMGVKLVESAIPVFERHIWEQRQLQVESVIYAQIQAQSQQCYASSFPNLQPMFDFMIQNPTAIIDGEYIYNVGLFIRSAVDLKRILSLSSGCETRDKCEEPVCNVIEEIDSELLYLQQEIFKILDSPGIVKENYPTVRALKEKADRLRMERTKVASDLMKSNFGVMQGDNAVLRDSRIVLPVKNDSRNKIEGYIQGTSQSGVTVFMEPFRLVDMNNAVVMAQQEIELEIARLLAYLTGLIRSSEKKIRVLSSQVARADFLYAFASWIRVNNCSKTLIDDNYSCNLINARHPLLKERCVPIDFCVKKTYRGVVLTGPNAGGKTVTMKTVGLFSLINQICGYIPASDGSSLQLFDRVFTDIGDDQSIENQLSTFSGHIKSIGFILRSITPDSLVILDELGSGTDPQEGAALARSVLEFCTQKAVLTLTTSHHGVLKQFAYASDFMLNASMEFDEKTLEPTFRVISGLPGESHAIDTAKRMHLPKVVTSNAQKYLGHEAVKISSIIRGLEVKRKEAEDAEAAIKERIRDLDEREKGIAQKEKELNKAEAQLKKEQLRDFDDYISKSRKELEGLVRELREGEITKEKTRKVKEHIQSLEREKQKMVEDIDSLEYEQLVNLEENAELKVGSDVLCGQYKREGTIVKQEKDGRWVVAIGPMKFTFRSDELSIPKRKITNAKSYILESDSKIPAPKLSLDVRGFRLIESIEAIENQIESCHVHGITEFSVIHGYGDGILSTGIHRYLKTRSDVGDYYFAHPEDGGQGKTYITLK